MALEYREEFLKIYANQPLKVRNEDIILVLKDEKTGIDQPITWNVAYVEVLSETPKAKIILDKLRELGII